MSEIQNPAVLGVFNNYPKPIRQKLMFLRQLVLDAASETEDAVFIEETLKWGEPSYLTKNGSTIRMDWKRSKPDQYALYFSCKTKLVDTFKELYGDLFKFEGNRAIAFNTTDKIPVNELKHCISLAIKYHRNKASSNAG